MFDSCFIFLEYFAHGSHQYSSLDYCIERECVVFFNILYRRNVCLFFKLNPKFGSNQPGSDKYIRVEKNESQKVRYSNPNELRFIPKLLYFHAMVILVNIFYFI